MKNEPLGSGVCRGNNYGIMKLFLFGKVHVSICRQWLLLLMYFLFCPHFLYAQYEQTETCIDFRVGSTKIDSTYMDNSVRLAEIMSFVREVRSDSTVRVLKMTFNGVASPEGNSRRNRQLAHGRMEALEAYVRSHIHLPDSLVISRNDHYIPWNTLIAMVESSDIEQRDTVLAILRGKSEYVPYADGETIDSRIPALMALREGRVWRELNDRFFAKLRNACAVLFTVKRTQPVVPRPESLEVPLPDIDVTLPRMPLSVQPPVLSPDEWTRRLYVKSNAVGVLMLIGNVSVEIDLDRHWSFAVPVYYSALNYFTSTVKFRTTCLQPELRYWFSDDNEGWFAGAHFGIAWYNYAKGGDYRYQDHNRATPALGGGISGGYRMPLSKNRRWWMEFSLGTGVYKLHYDVFENRHHGSWLEEKERTFFGIDHAAVSFAYRFDLKKKGGSR